MKFLFPIFMTFLVAVCSEPPPHQASRRYNHWTPKNAKQISSPKTKTLMVQIRSDHPVPIVLKGRPLTAHSHAQYMQIPQRNNYALSHHHHAAQHRPPSSLRPLKFPSPVFFKPSAMKPLHQLKIKLTNTANLHSKLPIAAKYEKPYKYEKPSTVSYLQVDLPSTTKASFISEHFAPIHTIPAPNLALHENHLLSDENKISSPKPHTIHQQQSHSTNYKNNNNNNNNHLEHQYQVLEDITNDVTFIDPISDSQKLFAPDPDPSLPTSKINPATEPYNTPTNGKPYPNDVQIAGAEHAKLTAPQQFVTHQQSSSPQLQTFISQQPTAIQTAAPLSNYDQTYLVTQSNNLYSQHKKQLFKPHIPQASPVSTYGTADLTQEVASDGQILQAGKLNKNEQINEIFQPQFSALVAAPALDLQTAAISPFRLPNVANQPATQGGFVISNYYNNAAQDSSQLLDAYEEEEAQAEAEAELQKLQQLQQDQLQHQQQQQFQLQQQQHLQEQQQQFEQQQQQFLQLQEIHKATNGQNQFHSQQLIQEQPPKQIDVFDSAFAEHERLVQQQLGSNTPLRIFVPDEDESRLRKRAGGQVIRDANKSQADHDEKSQ